MIGIRTNIPYAQYDVIDALNISKLKNMAKSGKHFQYFKDHPPTSKPMTLGTASHCAVLEPERFASDYVVWDRVTEAGKSAPRSGQHWLAFKGKHEGKSIITPTEYAAATRIATAVRGDPVAMRYLADGDAEVVLQIDGLKGRVDWATDIDGKPYLIGLKTARDIREFAFGSAAAKLGYHMQWAWYADLFYKITGANPEVSEIVVESAEPHDVVVYEISDDVMAQGREDYQKLLKSYTECVVDNKWPGIAGGALQLLSLPSWAYTPLGEDISDLDLETEL